MADTPELQSILAQLGETLRKVPSTVLGSVQGTVIPVLESVQNNVLEEIKDYEKWLAVENTVNMECMERARVRAAENLRKMGGHVSSDSKKLYRALTSTEFEEIRKLPDGRVEYKLTLRKGNVYYGDIVNKVSSIVITPKRKRYLRFIGYRNQASDIKTRAPLYVKGEGRVKFAKAVLWWSNAKGYIDEAFEYYSRPEVVEEVRQDIYNRIGNKPVN